MSVNWKVTRIILLLHIVHISAQCIPKITPLSPHLVPNKLQPILEMELKNSAYHSCTLWSKVRKRILTHAWHGSKEHNVRFARIMQTEHCIVSRKCMIDSWRNVLELLVCDLVYIETKVYTLHLMGEWFVPIFCVCENSRIIRYSLCGEMAHAFRNSFEFSPRKECWIAAEGRSTETPPPWGESEIPVVSLTTPQMVWVMMMMNDDEWI